MILAWIDRVKNCFKRIAGIKSSDYFNDLVYSVSGIEAGCQCDTHFEINFTENFLS